MVQSAIVSLLGNGTTRPRRITVAAIEKMVNLRPKQLDNMPMCKAEIQRHTISQEEYWAIEVVWGVNRLIHDNAPVNWKRIRELTNMRKDNLSACMGYLDRYADDDVITLVKNTLG